MEVLFVKELKVLKVLFTVLVWCYAVGGLLVLLTWSFGTPPTGIEWVMICVCVAFFGSKIWRRYRRKLEERRRRFNELSEEGRKIDEEVARRFSILLSKLKEDKKEVKGE